MSPTSTMPVMGGCRDEYWTVSPVTGMATVRVSGLPLTGRPPRNPPPTEPETGVTVRIAALDTKKSDAVHVPLSRVPSNRVSFSFTSRLVTLAGTPVIENTGPGPGRSVVAGTRGKSNEND